MRTRKSLLPTTDAPGAEQEFLHEEADVAVGDFHVDIDEEVESLGDEGEAEEISVEIPDVGSELPGSEEPVVDMDIPDIPPPVPSSASAGLPKKIAGYSIKNLLGTGGMGTVYLAQQEQPRRVVALKVMRAGIASRSALLAEAAIFGGGMTGCRSLK